MWVTQTYLSNIEANASFFIYYFFENYSPDQKEFTQHVQRELGKIGEIYGEQISLFMPNEDYVGKIEAEIRENRELWESLHGKLPGLFLSPKPLSTIQGNDYSDCSYIPFETTNPTDAATIITKVRGQTATQLISKQKNNESFVKRFADAIEIKPSIFGLKIDLRKFLQF